MFIVHGHDFVAKEELKTLLLNLGVEPVVLGEQDQAGRTIFDNYLYFAKQCRAACVLLTPDDQVLDSLSQASSRRPRPNVILELGWSMRHYGWQNVILLHKDVDDLELPSDIDGHLYVSFKESVFEARAQIRQRLIGQGMLPPEPTEVSEG